jgi:type VI secretion system secreted protein VgrG
VAPTVWDWDSGAPAGATTERVLATAQAFAVLAGTTVTNTDATTVHGDLGVDPGLAITGFPPGIVSDGTIHAADAVALQAQDDTTAAYTTLAGEASTANLSGEDLGGMTLTAGVYSFSSSAALTGALTLDGQGNPAAVFVFQIGSTLTTASNSSVVLTNRAQGCNVYWQVGSSATLGTTTAFTGSILALTSITLDTGATVSGRVLARNGAVTMDDNDVSIPTCASTDAGVVDAGSGSGSSGGSSTATTGSGTATGTGSSSATSVESGTGSGVGSSTSGVTSTTTSTTRSSTSTSTSTTCSSMSTSTTTALTDGGTGDAGARDDAWATGSPP